MSRSYLFVPGDSVRKLERGLAGDADALIVDLEDSVAPSGKDEARRTTAAFLAANPAARARLWVRVNAFDTGLTAADLAAAVPHRPAGIVLPKCDGIEHVARLSEEIAALEEAHGIPAGAVRIMGIVTETASSVLNLPSLRTGHPRLACVMWGAEDLAASLGAASNRDAQGRYAEPFQLARALCLMAAKAAGVEAIDAVYTAFRDQAGLEAETAAMKALGFDAKAAIHPDQVPVINRVYTPTAAELEWAHRIVAAFAAAPDAGVLRLDDRMIDRPHLVQARRLLGRATQ